MKKHLIFTVALAAIFGMTNCTAQTGAAGVVGAASTAGAGGTAGAAVVTATTPLLGSAEQFTSRDLKQAADTSGAVSLKLTSGKDTTITAEGVYLVSGTYKDTTIIVDAGDDAKVQLVLDGVKITNGDSPAVYVKSADKMFITTSGAASSLQVTGDYTPDGETNLDSVIFSRSDLTLNGTGSMEIVSVKGNGISTKDDLKITGGTISVTSLKDGLEANDSIRVAGGTLTVNSKKDALHSENDEDNTTGYVYISGGVLNLTAGDDGIQGTTITQIDGGTVNILQAQEGIEGTQVQINGGKISINAQDDGVNASAKSNLKVVLEVNGGEVTVVMAAGDTDAFDSNGDLYVRGGTITVTGQSAFDADGTAAMTGGTVTVNGTVVTNLSAQGFGRGGFGGPAGGRGAPAGGFGGGRR